MTRSSSAYWISRALAEPMIPVQLNCGPLVINIMTAVSQWERESVNAPAMLCVPSGSELGTLRTAIG